jgi:hypothetical protein
MVADHHFNGSLLRCAKSIAAEQDLLHWRSSHGRYKAHRLLYPKTRATG